MATRLVNRTERLQAVEQMLFRSVMGLRAVEIAEACGVDRRTIYRDLALLSDVGIPLEQRDGRFFINREHYRATIRLNFDEAVALFSAARQASHYVDSQNPHMLSALEKLCAALPEPMAAHISLAVESVSRHAVDTRFVEALETISRAWGEQRKVMLWTINDSGKLKAREFSTYFIEPTPTGTLYMVGYDEASHRIRAFKLQRVKRVSFLDATYEIPRQFDPRRYLATAWGAIGSDGDEKTCVVLAFTPEFAPLIKEHLWGIAQRTETLADDRVSISVQVADWREMLPWISSWGSHVEVLEPDTLRSELEAEAGRMVALYGAKVRS